MLTNSKLISTPGYWDMFYSGKNNDAIVDASNTKREGTFDRFEVVVKHVTKGPILDVGSGHAHICKRIKKKLPGEVVIASDQSEEARKIANYQPYIICSAYHLPYVHTFDTVICTQALEYMEEPERFLLEAKRIADNFICTVANGEMEKWSQLRIYTPESLKKFLEQYGNIRAFEIYEHLILAKIKFYG